MGDLPGRFGPYEIAAPLGAGGMGEVYRGRDVRLKRDVAIKILSEAAAISPDRQRRFTQEAVAASALNHPNILTVYDVGIENGIPYLVSELIDGVSLRAEMNRGRMPLKRMLDIALQLADGLAAAHDAGIVHRDLKPENVMVTRDGRVKIVDFGLAKADGDGADSAAAASATQTAAGLLIGTVPYMSPEQATGAPADFRSDQFSLGVILYELAAGTHPFRRDSPVQTLSAVIEDDPPSLASLAPSLPVPLRWVIGRLLAKDPRERFASTADLRSDLRTLRDYVSELAAGVQVPVTRNAPRRRWGRPLAAAALAAVMFTLGGVAGGRGDGALFDRFTPLATDAGYQGAPAWSPDGRTIAYVAEVGGVLQVFTRGIGSPMRTQITSLNFDCHEPYWSPDGTQIYFHSRARETESLWRVSAAGGSPEMIVEGAVHSAISSDGRTLVVMKQPSVGIVRMTLWVSSPPGGELRPYERGRLAGAAFTDGVLGFSPSGSQLLLWLWRGGNVQGPESGFWVIEMPDGEPRAVLPSLRGPRTPPLFDWLPDNRRIVMTRSDGPTPGAHLWLADLATEALRPVTATAGNEGSPSVSPDGSTVAFTSEANDFDLVRIPVDGSPLRPFLSSTRNEFDPAASPVNTQYAFVTDGAGAQEIWLRNAEGYLQQRLVGDSDFGGDKTAAIGALAFSPDGRRLAFQRMGPDGWRIWVSSSAGGTPIPLGASPQYQDGPSWSPDGDTIAFVSGGTDGGEWSLYKTRVGSSAAPPAMLVSNVIPFARPSWSPDGRWILCETVDGLAMVASDGSATRPAGTPGWLTYAWGADSRRFYGLRLTDDLHHFMLVSVDSQTGRETVVNPNLGAIPPANQPIRGFSRLRDGSFLTSIARVRSDIFLMEGFRPDAPWWSRAWPFLRPAGR